MPLAPLAVLATLCELSSVALSCCCRDNSHGRGIVVNFAHPTRNYGGRRLPSSSSARFYFGCDHGEAGLARARGFNRGIERKQICLPRNVADQVDDLADLLNRIGEASHMLVGRLRFGDRMRGNFGSLIDLTPDFADRCDQVLGGPPTASKVRPYRVASFS